MDTTMDNRSILSANPTPAALNFLFNLVPLPSPLTIAPEYAGKTRVERLQVGCTALHQLFEQIYQAGVLSPTALVPPGTRVRRNKLTDEMFVTYPRLLFAVGLFGKEKEGSTGGTFAVDTTQLTSFCAQARITGFEPFFAQMELFGISFLPFDPIQISFPAVPELIPALLLFARICRELTNHEVNPPVEFLRADMRLLQRYTRKIRPVLVTTEEVTRTLVDSSDASFIFDLDTWACSEGYSAERRCSGVGRSEFNVKFSQPRQKRTLFGFTAQSGRLKLHLNFNQALRILPFIAQTPRSFRELFYKKCSCAECGACTNGPIQVEMDGKPRRICHYAYMNLPEVSPEHYDAIQFVLKAQNQILKGG